MKELPTTEGVRLDKWMWAVRLFKTRSLAGKACESGRVKEGGNIKKPSSTLRGGEVLELPFHEGPGTRVVRVIKLIDTRVSASLASECCEDMTSAAIFEERGLWAKNRRGKRLGEQGRPTKRKRRDIEDHIGGFFD